MQCGDLVQTYKPLIRDELHWWQEKGITKDLLDRSTDAKVCRPYHVISCGQSDQWCLDGVFLGRQ